VCVVMWCVGGLGGILQGAYAEGGVVGRAPAGCRDARMSIMPAATLMVLPRLALSCCPSRYVLAAYWWRRWALKHPAVTLHQLRHTA
jgi:hypothetical protein